MRLAPGVSSTHRRWALHAARRRLCSSTPPQNVAQATDPSPRSQTSAPVAADGTERTRSTVCQGRSDDNPEPWRSAAFAARAAARCRLVRGRRCQNHGAVAGELGAMDTWRVVATAPPPRYTAHTSTLPLATRCVTSASAPPPRAVRQSRVTNVRWPFAVADAGCSAWSNCGIVCKPYLRAAVANAT